MNSMSQYHSTGNNRLRVLGFRGKEDVKKRILEWVRKTIDQHLLKKNPMHIWNLEFNLEITSFYILVFKEISTIWYILLEN